MTIAKDSRGLPGPSLRSRIRRLEVALDQALTKDRHAIGRQLQRLFKPGRRGSSRGDASRQLDRLEKRLQASIDVCAWPRQHSPQPTDIDILPITAHKQMFIEAIDRHPVVIVSGETGSGKSTQIPKFCLAAGRGIDGIVGCTQPRRIAAAALAARIADELYEPLGRSVGYKIRFQDRFPRKGFIKVMTDGILLAEAQQDRFLTEYDTLIVDEAHERSLNIDFVLGILKNLLNTRRDLKVVITSATIDTEKFAGAFDDAPIIDVSGRMYPVEVRYMPEPASQDTPSSDAADEFNFVDMAVAAVEEVIERYPPGDALVFMPTEQDIRETCEMLSGRRWRNTIILPLFARLSAADQAKVFHPTGKRKVIVATNVAETSLTIPGIKYVIDTGLARVARYNPRARANQLPIVPISRSSADQRKGRCGRVSDGICIRLYTEADYTGRPAFTEPEILRSNLADVILRMLALRLGDIRDFPFIDAPAEKRINDGFDLLTELGAVESVQKRSKTGNAAYQLTPKGRRMARMPIDPRLSCMLLEADDLGCLNSMAIIAAALSIQDPRERPMDQTADADQVHAGLHYPASDFITLLNIWRRVERHWRQVKSHNQMRKFCRNHFLSHRRVREWRDIYLQICHVLQELDMTCGSDVVNQPNESEYERFHKAVLSGLLSNIAVKKEKNMYQTAKGRQALVFPGSALFDNGGDWIVAAEMVETSRLFARTVANINPGWIEPIAKSLCRYSYADPHWDAAKGEVVAFEQVSLFGLIIADRRPVLYGRIDPLKASEMFIRSAIMSPESEVKHPFAAHNQKLIDEITDIEARLRRRDLLISEDALMQFYLERLKGVFSFQLLKRRISKQGGDRFLYMTRKDLLLQAPPDDVYQRFPDQIQLGDVAVRCRYAFQPGWQEDGITVEVPESRTATADADDSDWLVPGLLAEKIAALLKGLPKEYRKRLLPLADTAGRIAADMPHQNKPLINAMSEYIHQQFAVQIPASAWPVDDLPDHLKMRIAIIDPQGREIRSGRDKSILAQASGPDIRTDELDEVRSAWEQTGLTVWDFGDLPEKIDVTLKNGAQWTLYPGLQVGGGDNNGVDLRLFRRRQTARQRHLKGVAHLLALHLARELKHVKKILRISARLHPAAVQIGGIQQIEAHLMQWVAQRLLERDIRTQAAFVSYAGTVVPLLLQEANAVMSQTTPVLEAVDDAHRVLSRLKRANRSNSAVTAFIDEQAGALSRLVPANFMLLYDQAQWPHLQRYIAARAVRCQRAVDNLEKDRVKSRRLAPYQAALDALVANLSEADSDSKREAIEELFWLIEEFKISVYAPEIKTEGTVSEKRIDEKVEQIKEMI